MRKRRRGWRFRFKRWVKNTLHGTIITTICWSLMVDGAKAADWLFVVLAIVCEVSDE